MVPNRKSVSHSQTWTFFEGQWHEGNVPIMGPRTHGLWLGSTVFDGARAFEGVTPDLDRHCARVNPPSTSGSSRSSISTRGWSGA
jgi:branched-chain amino acid aminotransferase